MRTAWAVGVLTLARVASAQPDKEDPCQGGEVHGDKGAPAPLPDPKPSPEAPVNPAPPPPPSPVTIAAPHAESPAPADEKPITSRDLGFRFGSYGRVLAGTDLRGGKAESANIVAHGPRIVENSYLELDFSYGALAPNGMKVRPVVTLAFDGTLFHDTGNFDAQPALRNMFLEAQVSRHTTAWVGSKMYRGDDIYLFDYWPLDDQNTVGGGVVFRKAESDQLGGDVLELAGHVGFNRLEEPTLFQFQQVAVPDPEQGSRVITQLNRQRIVASATASYLLIDKPEAPNFKLKVHGEFHGLASGTRLRITDMTPEALPADTGYLLGAEIGTFGFAKANSGYRNHVNVFARYARGLAAFDELAPPTSFGSDLKAKRASELTFGASGNWDHKLGNIMLGALSRRFIDADNNTTDFDDGWEYAVDVRPLANLGHGLFAGADLSYQARFPRGLNAVTQRAEDPAVLQAAPMLVYSPMGPSGYDRPQLRLVYRVARLNDAARDLFVDEDPRREHKVTYFLGLQAEWWFNSSTYGH